MRGNQLLIATYVQLKMGDEYFRSHLKRLGAWNREDAVESASHSFYFVEELITLSPRLFVHILINLFTPQPSSSFSSSQDSLLQHPDQLRNFVNRLTPKYDI